MNNFENENNFNAETEQIIPTDANDRKKKKDVVGKWYVTIISVILAVVITFMATYYMS